MAALQMLAIARYRCALRLALRAACTSFAPNLSAAVHYACRGGMQLAPVKLHSVAIRGRSAACLSTV